MALGGSIKGFSSFIRLVVAVDGITLKHKYSAYLYIVSALDGNGQIFPVAFEIGDWALGSFNVSKNVLVKLII